jgi:formylglycine-generating enzyme required for sulfatase activity
MSRAVIARYVLIIFALAAVYAGPALGAAGGAPAALAKPGAEQPLAQDEIMDLVEAGMDNTELAKKVDRLGINFEPTEQYLEALRKAGAQDVLIEALRNANPQPLSKEQILRLVAGGVPSERAASLVKQHGIDFVADDKYLRELTVAGADSTLIGAVRTASSAVSGELLVETSPGATVYLDGETQGQADTKGELDVRAKLGPHTLKVSLAGKADFQQSVTLSTREATRFAAPLQDAGPVQGSVRQNPRDGLKYVWVPAGTFMMGCSADDANCLPDEKPAHSVTLTDGFWIGQTEIPVAAFKRFAGATGRSMPPEPKFNARAVNPGWGDDAMVMVDINWTDAQDYCRWAGGRLPTEAEWEYAARGGTSSFRYGNLDDIAWFADNSGPTRLNSTQMWNDNSTYYKKLEANGNGLHDVGQKLPNAYGLFDVLGNSSEWVSDWYDAHYYQNSPAVNPQGPATGTQRVLRGWNWFVPPINLRVSHRGPTDPTLRGNACAARCVWSGN